MDEISPLHCPTCLTGYREGFEHCSDCGTTLETGAPPHAERVVDEEDPPIDYTKVPRMVSVYTTNRIHGDVLASLLESNEIPTILSKEGYGSVLPLTVGPIGGCRILVREEDQAAALELIRAAEGGELMEEPSTPEAPLPRLAWWGTALVVLILVTLILTSRP